MLQQVSASEVDGPFEPAAYLSRRARLALDQAGVVFSEETEFDEPGPTQWAVVALDGGRQYLIVHHHAHPESFVELRASVAEPDAEAAVKAFADAVSLERTDVLHMVPPDEWPPGTP